MQRNSTPTDDQLAPINYDMIGRVQRREPTTATPRAPHTGRKIIATVVTLGILFSTMAAAAWNPFFVLLILLPVLVIVSLLVQGLTSIWRS